MSCNLTKGRLEPCKDKVGGIYKVYFANYGSLSGLTVNVTTDAVNTGTTDASLYAYELKGTSTFTQTMTSSRDAGTTFVTQTLTLSLKGLSATDNFELKNLAYGRPHVIVADNNGNSWIAGIEHGMDVQNAESSTGAALGDAYLYTITLVATERTFANYITNSSIALPLGGITGATIVVS